MNIREQIHSSWQPILPLLYQEPLLTLNNKILPNIYYQPHKDNIFRVFEDSLKSIKVVILGQDPYPTPGDANGLAFATFEDRKLPASLKVIIKELTDSIPEFKYDNPDWKTLDHWRKQGIFLLNTALTVESGKANSHTDYWKPFTKFIINFISSQQPCIWLLWGRKAQEYKSYIHYGITVTKLTIDQIQVDKYHNYILEASHPASELYKPGSGFYGCNHFNLTNNILNKNKYNYINF